MGSCTESSAAVFDVKKVAIIGAGPAGLAAAKYLSERSCFETIVIFEQRDEVGGIWNYSRRPGSSSRVPQTDPSCPPDPPFSPRQEEGEDVGNAPVFASPMYETLHANIPGSLMKYKDCPFPAESLAYPSREDIKDYLVRYSEEFRHLIKFCFRVELVSRREEHGRDRWDVKAKSTTSDESFNGTFDAVVVANGHYSIPFIPEVKGIRDFHREHPDVIIHSKYYRSPGAFKGKKVLVVGNGPSGLDITFQISEWAAETIISVRGPSAAPRLAFLPARQIGEIDEFLPGSKRAVRLKDGTIEDGFDAIVYCTGFLFSYPFLPELSPELLTSGKGVHRLYKHVFMIEHPTLAFPGLPMKAVPFPLAEAQAAVFSAVWANTLPLPPKSEMEKWDQELRAERGETLQTFPKHGDDGYYINGLHDWATKASEPGRKPPFWDDRSMWERSVFAEAKGVFEMQGCKALTLEELGFVYPGKAD